MKKYLFLFSAAALVLTSCVKTEVVDLADNQVISFDAHIDKATKSVTTVSTNTLTKFYVYCAKGVKPSGTFTPDAQTPFFDNVEITKNGNSYSYQHKQWEGGKTYRFMTYSDGNTICSPAPTFSGVYDDDNTKWALVFNDYEASSKDLIVGSTSGEIETNADLTNHTTVNLGFYHALARVQFVFFTGIAQNANMKIEDFTVEAHTSGDCVFTNSTNGVKSIDWTLANAVGDQKYTFKDPEAVSADASTPTLTDYDEDGYVVLPPEINKVIYECYVIPQPNTSLTVSLTIQTLGSDGSTVLSTIPFVDVPLALTGHTEWLPGNIYSYQAEIGTQSHDIHFSTTVNNWEDDPAGDKNITPAATTSGE